MEALAARTHRQPLARRRRRPPPRRPGAPLRDPRGGPRQGRDEPRPRDRGDPRLVRPPPAGPVRGRGHARARGGAQHHRLLPPPGGGRLAARPVLPQHRAPRDPPPLRGGGPRLPRVHPRPPPPDRDRAGAARACPPSGATSARPRSSRAGGCTPSACRTRWASTRATWTASASCRSTPGARPGSSSTPGMHALGWTRAQAIDFMLEHTALAPNNIANEVDRYIVLPGQALAYKTGQLELLRLRAEARERLGAAFDIRAFHDTRAGERGDPAGGAARRRRGLDRQRSATTTPGNAILGTRTGPAASRPRGTHGRRSPAARPRARHRHIARSRRPAQPAIRNLELAWSIGHGADWGLLVVALLVAYDAGGPALVALVSLTRMIPATLVNVLHRPGPVRPAGACAGRRQPRPGGRPPASPSSAIVLDVPVLVFVAVAVAAAASALVRPTTMALLPAVATTPDELVSANVTNSLGESLGHLRRAARRRARGRALRAGDAWRPSPRPRLRRGGGRRPARPGVRCRTAAGGRASGRSRDRRRAPRARAGARRPRR